MAACRYRISLGVLNLISYSFAKRRFHICKQLCIIIFLLHKHTNDNFFDDLPKISENLLKVVRRPGKSF